MKKLVVFVMILVCLMSLFSCSTMTLDIGEASKINIKIGLTGDEVTITDKTFIQNITEDINALRFEKTSVSDGKGDYVYLLTWIDTDNHQIAAITITEENGHQISHDGYYYKVGADLNIDTALIDEILHKTLSSAYMDSEIGKLIYGDTHDSHTDDREYTISGVGEPLAPAE